MVLDLLLQFGAQSNYSTFGDNMTGVQLVIKVGLLLHQGSRTLFIMMNPRMRYFLHVGTGFIYAQIGGDSDSSGTFAQSYRSHTLPEFFVGDISAGGKITALEHQ